MKLSQLLCGISLDNSTDLPEMEIQGICCDSREAFSGVLFVALASEKTERTQHIEEALCKGAKIILCPLADQEQGKVGFGYSGTLRHDYAMLACNWFGNPGGDLCLVGVTGTNGKTTTTFLLKAMLEGIQDGKKRKVGLIGTNENIIGEEHYKSQRTTPDAFSLQALLREMVDSGCTHVVMEVSSHALVQERVTGLQFAVGIFTNLSQDHLDYHHSMEAYQQAKARLFAQSDIAVLNLDDPVGRAFRDQWKQQGKPCVTYSENKDYATVYAQNLELARDHISFDLLYKRQEYPVYLPIPGGFSLYNALGVLGSAVALGLDLPLAVATFPHISGVKGRVEVLPCSGDFTVILDYAHTPHALENILLTAKNFSKGRLICLFGCGGNRDSTKRAIMGEIAEDLADFVVVTSDNPRFEEPSGIIADILQGMVQNKDKMILENRKEAIFSALAMAKPGDVLLLAGKGHECYQEISGVQYPFDEREIVAEYFATAKAYPG